MSLTDFSVPDIIAEKSVSFQKGHVMKKRIKLSGAALLALVSLFVLFLLGGSDSSDPKAIITEIESLRVTALPFDASAPELMTRAIWSMLSAIWGTMRSISLTEPDGCFGVGFSIRMGGSMAFLFQNLSMSMNRMD